MKDHDYNIYINKHDKIVIHKYVKKSSDNKETDDKNEKICRIITPNYDFLGKYVNDFIKFVKLKDKISNKEYLGIHFITQTCENVFEKYKYISCPTIKIVKKNKFTFIGTGLSCFEYFGNDTYRLSKRLTGIITTTNDKKDKKELTCSFDFDLQNISFENIKYEK